MNEAGGEELEKLLSSFTCGLDTDIESYLRERAANFEVLSKARTYLVVNEEELTCKRITDVTVVGYISLALKVLSVPEEISNRVRMELDGYSPKLRGEPITAFPVYLIGQLGRNSKIASSELSGHDLLEYAYGVIQSSVNLVGGRYILIECHPEKKLLDFYSNNGFSQFAAIPDHEHPMVQMIRRI